MKSPVEPPHRKDLHHQWWSSAASWKYVSATVTNAVMMMRIVKTMSKMLQMTYSCSKCKRW